MSKAAALPGELLAGWARAIGEAYEGRRPLDDPEARGKLGLNGAGNAEV